MQSKRLIGNHSIILVLGAGLEHKTSRVPAREWIGKQTRLRAKAAAKIWKQKPEAIIICSGGRSSPLGPSEAEAMKDFLIQSPWNIPAISIFTENDSQETAGNIRNTVRLMHRLGLPINNVMLIGGRRHLGRAARYCRAYGINTEAHSACSILGLQPEVVSGGDTVHEILLSLMQYVDRKGYIPTLIKRNAKNLIE